MATIMLKKLPDDLHRKVKMIQLELDEKGIKMSLEDIYIDLIKKGLDQKNTTK
jgi:hypothetical protein